MREGEHIFNLFLFIKQGVIQEIGIVVHTHQGNDSAKTKFLMDAVNADFAESRRFQLPSRFLDRPLTYDVFVYLIKNGAGMGVFEDAFKEIGAPAHPLICITPIINGKPRIEAIADTQGNIQTVMN